MKKRHSKTTQVKYTALVADDEPKARKNLLALLEIYCPEIEIIGEASNTSQAEDLIARFKPHILFQDIYMSDENALDLVERIQFNTSVIFVTAHKGFALRALRAGAVDYLLKPVRVRELISAVDKAKNLHRMRTPDFPMPGKSERIAVPVHGGLEILALKDILFIEADNSYSTLYKEKEKLTVCKSIGEFEALLQQDNFFRVHNTYLVNLEYVHSFSSNDGGRLRLSSGKSLPVAKRRQKELKEKFLTYYRYIV